MGHKENSGVAARIAAAQALTSVLEEGRNLDDALDQFTTKARLPENDRRLVHMICATVFRHLPQVDDALRRVMKQKRDPKPKILHNILRVGVAQLLYMEIPDHAAIDTCVSAVGSLKLDRQKSFVNACLRSVQRESQAFLAEAVPPLKRLPEWLADSWVEHYGQLKAETMAQASMLQAPIDITLNALKAPHENGQVPQGEPFVPWSIRVGDQPSHITSWPGFSDGSWWVQDLAASLPINMLGDIHDKSVLDIAAAPGGKTMQLVAGGARVTALDVAASRMARVSENLARTMKETKAHPVRTVVADAREWDAPQPFDAILLDAPCSSTGTLRRHPELPWIRSEKDMMTLGVIQRELLEHAAGMLVKGGQMIYCTCSLQPEEGEEQVEAFLGRHIGFKEIKPQLESMASFVEPGLGGIGFRIFPDKMADKGGMDGFFMALLQRQ